MGKPSLHDVWEWFRRTFKHVKYDVDKIAISVTQAIKTAADSPISQVIATSIDTALHSHLAEDALAVIKVAAIRALAVELALQGVPDNPSEDDILNFEKEVYKAIAGKDPQAQSKLWTSFAASLYSIIKEALNEGNDLTFAEIVAIVEDAYQAYKKAQEEAAE